MEGDIVFGLFKKKEEPTPHTVVVEVPIQQTSCVQPAEHAMLAKIRELQLEEKQIDEFLKSDPFNFEAPELNKFVDLLSARTVRKICDTFSSIHYWRRPEDYTELLSKIYLDSIVSCADGVNVGAVIDEISAINNYIVERKQKKGRLSQIKSEIKALKESLGI